MQSPSCLVQAVLVVVVWASVAAEAGCVAVGSLAWRRNGNAYAGTPVECEATVRS